jgi:CheY-like chemotaxis protein
MKILASDDYPLIQEALKHVLVAFDPTLELIQAQDASDAHSALSREPDTDLIVLDLALPSCDGELLADLRREWPGPAGRPQGSGHAPAGNGARRFSLAAVFTAIAHSASLRRTRNHSRCRCPRIAIPSQVSGR